MVVLVASCAWPKVGQCSQQNARHLRRTVWTVDYIPLNFRQDLTSFLHFRQCKRPNLREAGKFQYGNARFSKTRGKELRRIVAKKLFK
jgi:hypothetical protein